MVCVWFCLFVCLFEVCRPTREFFTHMETTSPLPVKGCKFFPMLGTHSHWAMRVLQRAAPTVTRGIRFKWSSPRTRDTHTCCRANSSGAVSTYFFVLCLSRLGFENPTFPLAGPTLLPTAPPPWLYCMVMHIQYGLEG